MAEQDAAPAPAEAEPEATEPATGEVEDQSTPDAPDAEPDKESADYWKRLKRETDQRNKRLTRELEQLRRESMSEQERAVAEAKDQGKTEAMAEYAGRLVEVEIRSAAVGRPLNVDALLANVDRTKFLGDDGDVDRDAIKSWLDELSPPQESPRIPDLGQGVRGVNGNQSPADVFGQLISQRLK